jgi:uncharacterized protein YbjQ (UPF0145 family)
MSKKDLTGLNELQEETPGLTESDAPPALEPSPTETIDHFESLSELDPSGLGSGPPPFDGAAAAEPPALGGSSFDSPDAAVASWESPMSPGTGPSGGLGLGTGTLSTPLVAPEPGEDFAQSNVTASGTSVGMKPLPLQGEGSQTRGTAGGGSSPQSAAPQSAATPPPTALELLKEFSERVPVGKPAVQAAFPFSLSIRGELAPEEKERILDILARENMGIREVDLEPQLAAGRILIPRISEFAGVMLVQAFRAIKAEMKLGPSDEIYSTEATRDPAESRALAPETKTHTYSAEPTHPAERIPVTSLPSLPELPNYVVLEVLTASAAMTSRAVEAENSAEYQELLENLQREIRYRAFLKGASAVVNFQVNLTSLGMPSRYRITATGSAVRSAPRAVV